MPTLTAKDIQVSPIASRSAHDFIRRHHYSGKSVNNSQLHLGVFLEERMVGVMQFGSSLDKRKLVGLISGTRWHEFIELNRLAMIDDTPRNTESRALSVAMRILRKQYPHIQWVVSFADATQCGDGTIYRAAGFMLTGIKQNKEILNWNGRLINQKTLNNPNYPKPGGMYYSKYLRITGQAVPLSGFQLRYIYFLDPTARQRLTVPEVPFSKIAEMGAKMYKGKRQKDSSEPSAILAEEGGAAPTLTLHSTNKN
tara:strand:+ start:213 stop:974 length:762 start_codon:yes stop_codon:yes gene_type:complete